MTIYLPNPDQNTPPVLYRWMQAVTNALRNATTSTTADLSGYLPTTTTVQGIGALGFSGTLADGTVLINLRPLDDSGLGTLLKITRDLYGRVSGTQEATAADLAYDPATSGLPATDVQAAIDSIVAGVAITVSDTAPAFPVNGQGWVDTTDGTFYIWYDDGTSAAWVAFGSAGGIGDAADITYDNSTSGLAATDVQAAIDEVAAISGGAGVGAQIGYAYTESSATGSTTSTFPLDTTIPQITEGAAYAAVDTTITPSAASSLLEVNVTISYASVNTTSHSTFALFRDSGADAIGHTFAGITGGFALPITIRAVVAAGSTAATTFKLRYGSQGGTGFTTSILSLSGTNYMGAAGKVTMTVREVKQ